MLVNTDYLSKKEKHSNTFFVYPQVKVFAFLQWPSKHHVTKYVLCFKNFLLFVELVWGTCRLLSLLHHHLFPLTEIRFMTTTINCCCFDISQLRSFYLGQTINTVPPIKKCLLNSEWLSNTFAYQSACRKFVPLLNSCIQELIGHLK